MLRYVDYSTERAADGLDQVGDGHQCQSELVAGGAHLLKEGGEAALLVDEAFLLLLQVADAVGHLAVFLAEFLPLLGVGLGLLELGVDLLLHLQEPIHALAAEVLEGLAVFLHAALGAGEGGAGLLPCLLGLLGLGGVGILLVEEFLVCLGGFLHLRLQLAHGGVGLVLVDVYLGGKGFGVACHN